MKQKLRILGIVAVLGATSIVIAQQGGTRAPLGRAPGRGPVYGSVAGGQGVSPVASAHPGQLTSNEVTELMSHAFCARQEVELELAKGAGHGDRSQPIIQATWSGLLTLLTPAQRDRVVASWQIEQFAPDKSAWGKVARTEGMARLLLNVGANVRAVAAKGEDDAWAPIMNRDPALGAPDGTPLERKQAHLARYDRAMKAVRAALIADARDEFDRIVARFDATVASAAAGNFRLP